MDIISRISQFNRMIVPVEAVLDGGMSVDSLLNEFEALYHELWEMGREDIARALSVAIEDGSTTINEDLIQVRNRILDAVVRS